MEKDIAVPYMLVGLDNPHCSGIRFGNPVAVLCNLYGKCKRLLGFQSCKSKIVHKGLDSKDQFGLSSKQSGLKNISRYHEVTVTITEGLRSILRNKV